MVNLEEKLYKFTGPHGKNKKIFLFSKLYFCKISSVSFNKQKKLTELSGGEFQRILIARTILSNAKFVLNNVPDTGRFAFNFGEASGTNTTGGFCTTYNGIGTLTTSNSCHGTAGGSTVNAAGSFQGTAITAPVPYPANT